MDGVDTFAASPDAEKMATAGDGMTRTFYEFFCGGGLVRLGLGNGWECVGAVDNDPGKAAAYRINFGDDGLVEGDVRTLDAADIPGLDLAWASFPCQDVSVAGPRSGLDSRNSGSFWPCWEILRQLVDRGRAPTVIALENVRNLLVSNGGRDFASIVGAMTAAGYRVGAVLLDASLFLPHSRMRVFIVAARSDAQVPPDLVLDGPDVPFHTSDLRRAVDALPPAVGRSWVWWRLPVPDASPPMLGDIVAPEDAATTWHTATETADLVATMQPRDLERLDAAKRAGHHVTATIYVRSRDGVSGRRRRANLRTDGVASCLVSPNGRGSSQIMVSIDGDSVRTRYMTAGEGARLMGLPTSYRLPRGYNDAFRIIGEGVAVPVVAHLACHLLEPLVASWRPRTGGLRGRGLPAVAAKPGKDVPAKLKDRPGIKGVTVGTTVYLLPEESKRLRRLALELDMSLHELLMRGADRLLAEHGQRPVQRYRPGEKTKGRT